MRGGASGITVGTGGMARRTGAGTPSRRDVLLACASGPAWLAAAPRARSAVPRLDSQASPARRPKAYWTAIVENGFAVPSGTAPVDLLIDLGTHFGDPDPDLRDRCGYGIAARWVVRDKRLSNADLQRLGAAWLPGLLAEHDPTGGDPVLFRSFSALGLSLVVAADLEQRALDGPAIAELVHRGTKQLRSNTDRRGFDPQVGWVHVTAHTADLLKFVGRHPALTHAHQRLILDSIAAAVTSTPAVFQWGEDERLSRAAASVLRRDDAEAAGVEGFFSALQAAGARVDWEHPLANGGLAPALAAKAVLKDLHLVLGVAGKDAMRQRAFDVLQRLP